MRAVERQKARWPETVPFVYNGQLNHKQIARFCQIDEASRGMLARVINQSGMSARAYDRVLRIARTIADLFDEDNISSQHIAEAIRLRIHSHAVAA
jgi:magnesium chelatase family protein